MLSNPNRNQLAIIDLIIIFASLCVRVLFAPVVANLILVVRSLDCMAAYRYIKLMLLTRTATATDDDDDTAFPQDSACHHRSKWSQTISFPSHPDPKARRENKCYSKNKIEKLIVG
jgi:hypothetical protein